MAVELPDGWEKQVQWRPWMQPVNQLAFVSLMQIVFINDSKQMVYWINPIRIITPPPYDPEDLDHVKWRAYNHLLDHIHRSAPRKKYANRVLKIPFKDQNWRVFNSPDLEIYEP